MKKRYDDTDPKSIENYANLLIGHKLYDVLDSKDRKTLCKQFNNRGKGDFGLALEKYYFKINPGNKSVPDFEKARVELKSLPLKKTAKGWWAKERLKFNSINYRGLAKEKWESCSLMNKNGHILLIFYKYIKGVPYIEYIIRFASLWSFPKEDLKIIKQDWLNIRNKVREGKAHELSEGDTLYLGACTSSSNSKTRTPQYNNTIKAKPRAFSLKPKYINFIIKEFLAKEHFKYMDSDKVVKNQREYSNGRTFEDIVIGKFKPYLNMTTREITKALNISISLKPKNFNALITRAVLGVNKIIIEEFEKADINIKSIALESTGTLKESISFPYFEYVKLTKETTWEESSLKELLEKRFFFVIYQKDKNGIKRLKKVMFWTMPHDDLEQAKIVWKETIKRINNNEYNELPGIKFNNVCHVRPHGRDSDDKIPTPDDNKAVKKSFWLNARYIREQINKT